MDDDFEWDGPLPAPDFTMVPNLVKRILPHLQGGEAKVLWFLIMETYGWHRAQVQLTLPAICVGAGVSRRTAAEALKEFEAHGLVEITRTVGENGTEANSYTLLITADQRYISYTPGRQEVSARSSAEGKQKVYALSSLHKERKKEGPTTDQQERITDQSDPDYYRQGKYGHLVE